MREKRFRAITFAAVLCFLLAAPLLAANGDSNYQSADVFNISDCGDYPTIDGEPLFTLHIVVPEEAFIAIESGNIISESLHDIGIEGVVHPLPFFTILRGLSPEDYGVDQYGFERPCPSGAPCIVTVEEPVPTPQHAPDEGVVWFGADDPSWVTPPGYGNNWDQSLTKEFQLSEDTELTYSIQYDVEDWYDFVFIEVSTDGVWWDWIEYHTGTSIGFEEHTVDLSYFAGQEVGIRFRFTSDVAWSDEDGLWDTNGACRIDWAEVTGFPRNEFTTGMDGWIASSEPVLLDVMQGYDIAFHGLNFDEAYGSWRGFGNAHSDSTDNQGYFNPEYDALVEELYSLPIDWNANYPDPPDLSSSDGIRALEILGELQAIWKEDQPTLILFNRMLWGGGGTSFPIAPLNFNNEHLAISEVRQAINLAMNRQAVLDLYGYEPPAETYAVDSWLAPWHPGFDPVSYAEYDPEQARQILYDAGYTNVIPPYTFSGVLPPINADGTSVFKQGRTIPVKFQLFDHECVPGNYACAKIEVAKVSDDVVGDFVEVTSTSEADTGDMFRYDPLAEQYIFNLSTKDLEKGTYILRITMGDGQFFEVQFKLR